MNDNSRFGRISLRRRAILRLPVTPSRRTPGQSNRQRNFNSPTTSCGNRLQTTPNPSNSLTVAKSSPSSSSSLWKNNSMSSVKQSFIDHNNDSDNNRGNLVIDNNSNSMSCM
ncbi:unnamed protein product [Trichobilharzia regenti]|nr:unnamed protein product [Trichobilharzia regenti]